MEKHIDPLMAVIGIVVALSFAVLTFFGRRRPKPPTLAAPPPNIHIDPENVPVVHEEQPRKWTAADATVQMGVPLKPRQ